jgi:ergothioneine biosynthesis protein EgtB
MDDISLIITAGGNMQSVKSAGTKLPDIQFNKRDFSPDKLLAGFNYVRSFGESLCEPLETEDYVVQSMPDASPTKWHLAHTTWFFETFILRDHLPDYTEYHPLYNFLFNSYYNAIGDMWKRPVRGMLSRPTVEDIYKYREHVNEGMARFIKGLSGDRLADLSPLIVLGLHHEQQHQELILTDIKHVLSHNPLHPRYREKIKTADINVSKHEWLHFPGGMVSIGHEGEGFYYDNEGPRHETFMRPYLLANRLVTCGEYINFIDEGGYKRPEFWLDLGWYTVKNEGWQSPLYWERYDGEWRHFTLNGFVPVNLSEPITHLSYFEADAYARWAECRLPTEFEWEAASGDVPIDGNLVESGNYHTRAAELKPGAPSQMYGDVWEWTQSHYSPYPGFVAAPGAVGEYNGKFMVNQFVLRGGSFGTSATHVRPTYRNFWAPHTRFQFSGLRLAKDQ